MTIENTNIIHSKAIQNDQNWNFWLENISSGNPDFVFCGKRTIVAPSVASLFAPNFEETDLPPFSADAEEPRATSRILVLVVHNATQNITADTIFRVTARFGKVRVLR
jgi:hypothetical protein